jgi:hypothetical protein
MSCRNMAGVNTRHMVADKTQTIPNQEDFDKMRLNNKACTWEKWTGYEKC